MLCACIGGRGSGKTTPKALSLVKWYDKAKTFDRIIIFSSTLHREPKGQAFLSSKTNADITFYTDYNEADMKNEMNRMEADIAAYRDYKRRLEIWNKYVRNGYDIENMEYMTKYGSWTKWVGRNQKANGNGAFLVTL